MTERRDGHRSPVQEAAEVAPDRNHLGQRRRQGRPRREDGAQVPRLGPAPQSTADPPYLADPAGPVPGRLARTPGEAPARSRAPGQDPVSRPATPVPGPLPRRATADPSAADQTVAGPRGAAQGGVLRTGPSTRSPLCLGLHAHGRARRHDRRRAVRPPGLSLRADLLQLGDRHGLLLGELGEPGRGVAERPVGTGRGPSAAPHRSAECRDQSRLRHRDVYPAIPGDAVPLRPGGPGDPTAAGARERRRRAESLSVQTGRRPGPDVARQPRVRRPRLVRGVPQEAHGRAQRQPQGAVRRGAGRAVVAAGAAARDGPTGQGTGRRRQHDPRRRQYLLGAEPPDRRAGRRPRRGRTPGGLAWGPTGGPVAAASWPWPAEDRVPPRDRLAGPQAGGVPGVSLPRRDVPDQPVPDGVRRAGRATSRPGGEGVPGDPPPGGEGG